MTTSHTLLAILVATLFAACESFQFSPYEVDPPEEYRDINVKSILRLPQGNIDTLCFAVIGDTQRSYEETDGAVSRINANGDCHFVIHTGDIVDFGLQREFIWMHDVLKQLDVPYIAVLGNHDVIGNGDEIYRLMYGPANFSFVVDGRKFVFVNTNSREFDFENVPDVNWLNQALSDTTDYDQAFIVCHVPPANSDFNNDLEDEYVSTLTQYGKTAMHINGHNHAYNLTFPYGLNIPFVNSADPSNDEYVRVKVWSDGYEITRMPV